MTKSTNLFASICEEKYKVAKYFKYQIIPKIYNFMRDIFETY